MVSGTPPGVRKQSRHRHVFYNFKWYLGGLGVSGGMARTIRTDFLELWWDLVLHGMGEVDFHVFGEYWKLTLSPNTSKLILGPPRWSLDCFWDPLNQIKPINFPKSDTTNKIDFPGTWTSFQNRYFLTEWLPFFCLFWAPCLFFLGR